MQGLIELAALVLGTRYLVRLCTGRRTIRVRFVQRPVPSAPMIVGVALVLIVLAAIGA
jgi:hypothetical protein